MRWDAKVDENQREIVMAVREIGGEAQSLHRVGQGVPDLLVAFRGNWYVVEIKKDDADLTDREQEWHDKFGHYAPIHIWRTWQDVMDCLLLGGKDGE